MPGAEVDYSIQTTRMIEPKDSPSPLQCSESATKQERAVDVSLTWLAGFIDGEGHFSIQRQKTTGSPRYYARINVTNTNLYTLQCIRHTFGGSISHTGARKNPRWKKSWRWSIHGDAAWELAAKLKRHLITKRQAVRVFTEFCKYRNQQNPNLITLAKYRQRMKATNRRGI